MHHFFSVLRNIYCFSDEHLHFRYIKSINPLHTSSGGFFSQHFNHIYGGLA